MGKPYRVGWGKPPHEHKYPKGKSGNPKGRPKGSLNLKTDLLQVLKEGVRVKEGDRLKKMTKQRAMLVSVINKALHGDTKAADLMLKLVVGLLTDNAPERDNTDQLSPEDEKILEGFLERTAGKSSKTTSEDDGSSPPASDKGEHDEN